MAKKKAAKKSAKSARKKKAGKKKATRRKKAVRTRAVKPRGPVLITIKNSKVSKRHAHGWKTNPKDGITWKSKDKAYTLTFDTPAQGDNDAWPFTPSNPSHVIPVPAMGSAGPFYFRDSAVHTGDGNGYGYKVAPAPPASGRPKPNPEVIPDP